jgi:hypothetical protein
MSPRLPEKDPNDSFRAMNRKIPNRWWLGLAGAVTAAIGSSCDDPFSAFLRDVPEIPGEATLVDFVSGDILEPPAFDLVRESTVRVDQTSQWDFLYRITGGQSELVPFGAIANSASQAGLIRSTSSFEGVLDAPDTGYETSIPLAVSVGDVLVIRSRRDRTQILICNRFAKIEILDIDETAGSMTFRFLVNPNCGDTVLEPGTHGTI